MRKEPVMRRASILVFLSVALLAPGVSDAAPKKAVPPPACAGRDIFTAMKRSDPDGYAKIRAAADATPNTRALLWRIEGKGQPASYLFGTMHSTDERVNKRSSQVVEAFNAAKIVALEYLESESPLLKLGELVAAKGVYTEGNGLKDLLTPAELAVLRKALGAEGIPAKTVHLLRPWFAGLALALPVCEKKRSEAGLLPLDKRLEREAVAQGKRVVGLETAALQIDALVGMPDAVQVKLLKGTVATLHLRNDALEVLHRAYLGRDLGTTLPFTKRLMERAGHDPSPIDTVESEIAVKRNYGMRDASLPLLEQGGAFIAVGALHLLGKEGLVELLRAAGHTVTPIE
jgi:uncharacterized protein YbaP (TraB family)